VTAKEMVLPVGKVITLLSSVFSVARSYGTTEARYEAVKDIQVTLGKIEKKLDDQDGRYLSTYKLEAELQARLAVLEKSTDTQAAINVRLLAHLDAKRKE